MTTVTLTSSELRHSKAILIAADCGQWLRPDRLIDGRRAVGIPSQTKRGLYHWTDGVTCSCYDFRRRQLACKHVTAYRLDAIARPAPQPASDTVDGLAAMVDARQGPVLDMVRHPDGEISWERHEHTAHDPLTCDECGHFLSKHDSTCSQWTEPLPPMTDEQAARIFGRL